MSSFSLSKFFHNWLLQKKEDLQNQRVILKCHFELHEQLITDSHHRDLPQSRNLIKAHKMIFYYHFLCRAVIVNSAINSSISKLLTFSTILKVVFHPVTSYEKLAFSPFYTQKICFVLAKQTCILPLVSSEKALTRIKLNLHFCLRSYLLCISRIWFSLISFASPGTFSWLLVDNFGHKKTDIHRLIPDLI